MHSKIFYQNLLFSAFSSAFGKFQNSKFTILKNFYVFLPGKRLCFVIFINRSSKSWNKSRFLRIMHIERKITHPINMTHSSVMSHHRSKKMKSTSQLFFNFRILHIHTQRNYKPEKNENFCEFF